MSKKVAFYTLGCKLNFSETAAYSKDFEQNGYEIVPHSQKADIYVVNTCTVTEHADKKCRNIIRKFHRQNPESIIAVTGCYAQLKPKEISDIDGVCFVFGAQYKKNVVSQVIAFDQAKNTDDNKSTKSRKPSIAVKNKSLKGVYSCDTEGIQDVFSAYSSTERTRAFLKVQDGCDYKCTYCTIPLARGASRNISIANLVKEAEKIASEGTKEIVITGVNTGDFGRSTAEDFLDLLKALNEVDGIERFRISSIEPNLLREDILRWIATQNKFMHHFHIPLQSGSDNLLKLMKRRYNTTTFKSKINFIRSIMDNVFFGIDVIVGFPGETDELFQQTYDFLKDLNPAYIHVFPYSRRPNTPADLMPNQISSQTKEERVQRLIDLSNILHKNFYEMNVGRIEDVLFENTQKDELMFGYTRNYIRVKHNYDPDLCGKIISCTLSEDNMFFE